jgi:hypothetical protein
MSRVVVKLNRRSVQWWTLRTFSVRKALKGRLQTVRGSRKSVATPERAPGETRLARAVGFR